MTVEGVFTMYVGNGSGSLPVAVFLWEGQATQAAGSTDYVAFDFFWGSHTNASGKPYQYDGRGWLNPNPHSYSGGDPGSGTVPAMASIIIPADGVYWSQFNWKADTTLVDAAGFNYVAHMGVNNDFVDTSVGNDLAQNGTASFPDAILAGHYIAHSGPELIQFTAGDIVFWAGLNNSTSSSMNLMQGEWMFGPFTP